MAEGGAPQPRISPRLILLHYLIINSIPAILLSRMQRRPPPPLLPVKAADDDDDDGHPVAQNLKKLELGKFALTLATTATLGLLFSRTFTAAEGGQHLVVLGFMAACTAVWNGMLFERMFLQNLGITLVLLCFYGLVGSFLPSRFSWACWLLAAFSLIPFLSLLINSLPLRS